MGDPGSSWSLQSRVGFISTVALCTGLVFGSVGMDLAAAAEDVQVIDQRVDRLAKSILQTVEEDLTNQNLGRSSQNFLPIVEAPGTELIRYQVWMHDGAQLLRSHNAPDSRPLIPFNVSGLIHITFEGGEYSAYSAATQDRKIVVQVALRDPPRMVRIGLHSGGYLAFILIPFVFILGTNCLLIKQAFRPLDMMADDLRQRGLHDTTALNSKNLPSEMLPIWLSLDSHFRRVDRAMSAEQRFTSVAAHELRTPLAGIRAQAQIASKATELKEAQESLKLVMHGVDRAARVIDQLIDLNRVESTDHDVELGTLEVSLADVCEEVLDDLSAKATAKKIKIGVSLEVDQIHGLDSAINMLLRNLITNAILYCPIGSSVNVCTQRDGEDVILTVDDSGPGIPAHAREAALGKFNRLGINGSEGVGLGLSIVAHVVALHWAKLDLLDSPLGGLRVRVIFRPLVQPS